MTWRQAVYAIAAAIPADLRSLRGRMMLESENEFIGVDEVPCPACDGDGWLSRRRLERCPVCVGFCDVPEGLADWFRAQAAACREEMANTATGADEVNSEGSIGQCAALTTAAPFV